MTSWIDEYDSVAEFYFWEPQHLGRISARSGKNFAVILGELRKKEVPLNHLLNYFLHLAPSAMIARIYRRLLPGSRLVTPTLRGREAWQDITFCQPDVWLSDPSANAFIELKLGSQLSYSQVFRYAALAAKDAPALDACLVLLGPTDRFRQADVFEQHRAQNALAVPEELLRKIVPAVDAQAILASAQRMRIAKATFSDLIAALDAEIASLGSTDEGHETLSKLLCGLRDALARVQ